MFNEAIGAVRSGDKPRARDLLTRLIKANSNQADYWVWMSAVVDSPKERIYCLQEALRRDPVNAAARRGLILLGALPPEEIPTSSLGMAWRNWQPVQTEAISPEANLFNRKNAPRLAMVIGALVLMVGLVVAISLGLQAARRPATLAVRRTLRPSATLLPTTTPVVRSPTPTFVGPTPLWMFLDQTYTPTPVYVGTPHPFTEAYRMAMQRFQRGDYPEMAKYMQQVVQNEPDAVDAYYYLGESYRLQGFYEQAAEQYVQAVSIDPAFAPAHLGLGRVQSILDPAFDAGPELIESVRLDPNLAEGYLELARYSVQRGDAELADQYLQQAEARLPNSALVTLTRAEIALLLGENGRAVELAQQANQIDLTMLAGYKVLGQAFQADGQLVNSVGPLEVYTRYIENDLQVWIMLAKAYQETGEIEKALNAYDLVLSLDEENFDATLQRGLLWIDIDPFKAITDLGNAVKLNNESYAAYMGLVQAYMVQGNSSAAYQYVERALRLAQTEAEQAEATYWRARVLTGQKQVRYAAADWVKLLAMSTEVVPADWVLEAQVALGTAQPSTTPTVDPNSTPTP